MTDPALLIDITRPVTAATPVWPGDAPFQLVWTQRVDRGDGANVAEVRCSVHAGTHADAPFHVASDGRTVGEMPLEPFVGEARVVDARGHDEIGASLVEDALRAGDTRRLLFRTGAWADPERFPECVAGLTAGAAERLREAGVVLVGTDAPSVDPLHRDDLPAHRVLCGAGIAILENLLLDGVPPGDYHLTALPLRWMDADGSPVRAVLRPL